MRAMCVCGGREAAALAVVSRRVVCRRRARAVPCRVAAAPVAAPAPAPRCVALRPCRALPPLTYFFPTTRYVASDNSPAHFLQKKHLA